MNPYSAPMPSPYVPSTFDASAHAHGYDASGGGATVSEASVEMLRQTRPWVVFMSVMAFVGSGLMIFAGIAMILMGAFIGNKTGPNPIPPALLGVIYLPLAAVYIYPAMKLWSYGSAISRLVASRSSFDLEAALGQQKSFWKFIGIASLVIMVLYAVLFIGALVVGVATAAHGAS